ncbi:MAG: hypothetical protein HC933_00600 [Pleurocapsa sp. SU_196_0]|nr:hypothetical protein [Pleurocapsa sp. SU_196_0]
MCHEHEHPPNPPPGRPEEYDWDNWKRLYARGEDWVTLEVLSSVENAPSLDSLKRHSAQEGWAEERKQFRHDNATKLRQLDQLNTLEIKQRQAKLGRAGQMIVAQAMANPEKIVAALRENPTALANVMSRLFSDRDGHLSTGEIGLPITAGKLVLPCGHFREMVVVKRR